MTITKERLYQLVADVEAEWSTGGLSGEGNMYADLAVIVAQRAIREAVEEERDTCHLSPDKHHSWKRIGVYDGAKLEILEDQTACRHCGKFRARGQHNTTPCAEAANQPQE